MARKVAVIRDNSLQEAEDSEVDIELRSPSRLFGSHPNIIPLANNTQPTRSFYGSRMANQAMPLENPEAPLIRSLNTETGKSFEEEYGEGMGARLWRSEKGGTVKSVKPGLITVTDDDGEDHDIDLYDNFEFNRKTQLHNRPVVQPGDKVKPGQVLAASNFTDDSGVLAMGKNARIAVVPYKGYSLDDAVVVSESFAKRMTSQHAYEESMQTNDGTTKFGKTHFSSLFPRKFTQEQLDTIGDDGVVRPGTVLHKGDPIILATRPKTLTSETAHLGKLGKVFRTLRNDASVEWEHDYPGYVTDSLFGKKNAKAFITAQVPLKVGDKVIQSRVGQKSIVSKILPDEQMLRSLDGKPFEILLNPLALPSRINTATLHEIALGKVAAKTGKPIAVPSFGKGGESRLDYTNKMLADNGLSATEEVFDPVLNRKLAQPVSTGVTYAYKLHHVVESKKSARGQGSYSLDEQPVKGGGENAQAKRLGGLEVTALLAKGGYDTLREATTLRGQCFDSSTEVLTKRGWVHWGSVLPTDELYTKNKEIGGVAWYERPINLVENDFNGELVGYEGKHLDWLVTPGHNLWGLPYIISKSKSGYKLRTYNAKSVYGKEGIVESFGAVYEGTLPDDYILEFSGADHRSKPMRMSLYDYCEFMGWYLSEGSCSVDSVGRGRVIIAQDRCVHPEEFAEVERLMRRIGFTSIVYGLKPPGCGKKEGIAALSKSPAGTPVLLRGHSAPFAKHLKQFGDRAWVKRIPDIIFEASPAARRAFIAAYAKGDGYTALCRKPGKKFSEHIDVGTTSPYIAEGLQRLAVITGYGSWVGLRHRAGRYNYKHDYYRVVISENLTTQTFRKRPAARYVGHYKTPYSGKVYCATMRTGLLYVRRNGKCMWSGNSNRDYWSMVRQGFKPHAPGVPFVFNKFLYLLNGAGINVHDEGKGKLRLKIFTDSDLRSKAPRVVRNGGMVDGDSLEGVEGGLFDKNLVAGNSWGSIPLVEPMLNPAAEQTVLHLLGMKEKDLRSVLAGEMDIDEARGLGNKR